MNWGVNGCMSCPDNNGSVSTNNNPAIYWGLFDSQHYDEPTINGCSLGTERKFLFYFFSPLAPLRGKLLNLNRCFSSLVPCCPMSIDVQAWAIKVSLP